MEDFVYLIVDYGEFKDKVNSLTTEGTRLYNFHVNNDSELATLNSEFKDWKEQGKKLFSQSFSDSYNDFCNQFQEAGVNRFRFNIPGATVPKKSIAEQVKAIKDEIQQKNYVAINYVRLIDQCEYIKKGKEFNFAAVENLTMKQKASFILEKLYDLNDGSNYPIKFLLDGNGIKLKHYSEPREIAKFLEERSFIETLGGLGDEILGSITMDGSIAIEESREVYKENYSEIPSDKGILNEKIDEIIEVLKKHDAAHEVLFNELQDLKELYGTLPKKNFGELLKGKLFDLALGKIISVETANFIFSQITGHDIKLLG